MRSTFYASMPEEQAWSLTFLRCSIATWICSWSSSHLDSSVCTWHLNWTNRLKWKSQTYTTGPEYHGHFPSPESHLWKLLDLWAQAEWPQTGNVYIRMILNISLIKGESPNLVNPATWPCWCKTRMPITKKFSLHCSYAFLVKLFSGVIKIIKIVDNYIKHYSKIPQNIFFLLLS